MGIWLMHVWQCGYDLHGAGLLHSTVAAHGVPFAAELRRGCFAGAPAWAMQKWLISVCTFGSEASVVDVRCSTASGTAASGSISGTYYLVEPATYIITHTKCADLPILSTVPCMVLLVTTAVLTLL